MSKSVVTMWLCVVGMVLGASAIVWAASPLGTATTYQGRLMDGDSPADGEYDFEFKLYTDSAAGYQVGITVNKENEPVSAGLFTVQLDLVGSDPNAFNGEARWLAIGVRPGNDSGSFTSLSPRQEMTPTPYAIYAANAGTDNDWTISGNDMFSAVSGNVGIGTMPGYPLDVRGSVIGNLGHFYNNTFSISGLAVGLYAEGSGGDDDGMGGNFLGQSTTASYGTRNQAIAYGTGTAYGVYSRATFGQTTGPEYAFYGLGDGYFSGNVGIGTPSPSAILDVGAGAIRGSEDDVVIGDTRGSGGRAGLELYTPTKSGAITYHPTEGMKLWVDGGGSWLSAVNVLPVGYVGIGTTIPQGGLHVSGNGGNGTALFERSGKILALNPNYGGNNTFAHISTAIGSDMGLKLDVNEQTEITITTGGNIGIGTTSPDPLFTLDVAGGIKARGGTGGIDAFTTTSGVVLPWFAAVYGAATNMDTYGYLGGIYGAYGRNDNSGNYGYLGGDYGAYGEHTDGNYGLLGHFAYGVVGRASLYGVFGLGAESDSNGVYGGSENGKGVRGHSYNGIGVYGSSDYNYAGYFDGNVYVDGVIIEGGGGFMIDHPLEPANKCLQHSFVESPDMKNVYDGVAMLDAKGQATVELPDWFEALNRDFRYQLTAIGVPAPNLYIAEEISGNRFRIGGGEPGMKVSWQVTGIRQDAWANEHRLQVEVEKEAKKRGKYLHPVEHGVSETLGVDYEETKKMDEELKRMKQETSEMRKKSKG